MPKVKGTTKVAATPAMEAAELKKAREVIKRITGESPKEGKFDSYPLADREMRERINRSMEMRETIGNMESVLREDKDELIAHVVGMEFPGLRTETAAITVSTKSRSQLSKEKLLTKLSVAELEECYDTGAEYYEIRFTDLRPKEKK